MRKVVVLAARSCPRQIGQTVQARWWAQAHCTAQRPRRAVSAARQAQNKHPPSVLGRGPASS
eukprot:2130350-Pyramimonas_sp.AAC.1